MSSDIGRCCLLVAAIAVQACGGGGEERPRAVGTLTTADCMVEGNASSCAATISLSTIDLDIRRERLFL